MHRAIPLILLDMRPPPPPLTAPFHIDSGFLAAVPWCFECLLATRNLSLRLSKDAQIFMGKA
jgi:hypothetical protein